MPHVLGQPAVFGAYRLKTQLKHVPRYSINSTSTFWIGSVITSESGVPDWLTDTLACWAELTCLNRPVLGTVICN